MIAELTLPDHVVLPMRAAISEIIVGEVIDAYPFSPEVEAAALVLRTAGCVYRADALCKDALLMSDQLDVLAKKLGSKFGEIFDESQNSTSAMVESRLALVKKLADRYRYVPFSTLRQIVTDDYLIFLSELAFKAEWECPGDPGRAFFEAGRNLRARIGERIAEAG